MNETFTTALYLFSSLLQADAAILGFGAIFVIYKLQTLDTKLQLLVQLCYTRGSVFTNYANNLILAKTDENKVKLFKDSNRSDQEVLEPLISIPKRSEGIRSQVKYPLIVIGLHSFVCAVLLWFTPRFTLPVPDNRLIYVIYVVILWFGVGILVAGWLAVSLLTRKDELSLERLDKEMYESIHKSS